LTRTPPNAPRPPMGQIAAETAIVLIAIGLVVAAIFVVTAAPTLPQSRAVVYVNPGFSTPRPAPPAP